MGARGTVAGFAVALALGGAAQGAAAQDGVIRDVRVLDAPAHDRAEVQRALRRRVPAMRSCGSVHIGSETDLRVVLRVEPDGSIAAVRGLPRDRRGSCVRRALSRGRLPRPTTGRPTRVIALLGVERRPISDPPDGRDRPRPVQVDRESLRLRLGPIRVRGPRDADAVRAAVRRARGRLARCALDHGLPWDAYRTTVELRVDRDGSVHREPGEPASPPRGGGSGQGVDTNELEACIGRALEDGVRFPRVDAARPTRASVALTYTRVEPRRRRGASTSRP